jgi:hypothetical protein
MSQDNETRPTTTNAPSPARAGGSSGGRVAALIAGSLVGLLAVGLVIAGGVLLWGNSKKDDAGYVSTSTHRLHTSTYAITTDNLDVNLDAPGWLVNHDRFGHIRIEANSRSAKPVFVGVAPTRDVARYLANTAHSAVTDIDDGPFRSFHVTYRDQDGHRHPAAPIRQRFWAASADGTGAQAMTWKVRDGNWSIVVMNADGSAGVNAGISAGANVPFLAPAGWISLGGGLVLLAAAAGLLVFGSRTPRQTRPDRADTPQSVVAPA